MPLGPSARPDATGSFSQTTWAIQDSRRASSGLEREATGRATSPLRTPPCSSRPSTLPSKRVPQIFRLSLTEGRFLTPLASASPAINACGWCPSHGMLACAGEDGGLECFDPRAPKSLGVLGAAAAVGAAGQGLTALR